MEVVDVVIVIIFGKFVFSGGGNCLIWVILLCSVEKEVVYCVYFEGVRGLDGILFEGDEQVVQVNVGVSLVWGVLVNVLFVNGSVDL